VTSGHRFAARSGPAPKLAAAVAAIAAIVVLVGLIAAPERTWLNLLLNGFYLTSLAVSAIFFLATQRLSGARWSAALRRVPEALMAVLPFGAVVMIGVFFARETIYGWSRPDAFLHESALAGKVSYLQPPFVFLRLVIALSLWGIFAWLFRKTSLAQDEKPGFGMRHHRRLNRYAAAFLLVFAPSFTVGSYDWIMSLEPGWFSTMFAVYVFAGTFVQGIAAITLAVVVLRERGAFGDTVSDQQLHDLGKMLFAFSTFWAYIWTCQYLLIWYGNIPEEAAYYAKRTSAEWLFVFGFNFVINWVVPFAALLSARAKQRPRVLVAVSSALLFGHWLDLYLLIMPARWDEPNIGIVEVTLAAGSAALAYLVFVRALSRAAIVPVNDPVLLAESLHASGGAHAS
jgi:hypothetical protein